MYLIVSHFIIFVFDVLISLQIVTRGHGDNGWKYVPRIIRSLAGRCGVQVTGSYKGIVTGNGDLYYWVELLLNCLHHPGSVLPSHID
jgi:hypothetical protein